MYLLLPDLFEPSSGFVLPPDPWDNGVPKTIYQRLVEEIAHAGRSVRIILRGELKVKMPTIIVNRSFTTDEQGIFSRFDQWSYSKHGIKPYLAENNGRDGNGHLIVK